MLRKLSYKTYSLHEACKYIAFNIQVRLQDQISRYNQAGLVLTGGSSIVNFLPEIQGIHIPWDKVTVFLSDDRLVDINDPASNERLLKVQFFNKKSMTEQTNFLSIRNIFLAEWENEYQKLSGILTHSVVVLSMGVDGHVASLFNLGDLQGESCLTYVTRVDFNRVSLSYKALLSASKVYLIVYGAQKIDFFEKLDVSKFYLRELFELSEVILVKDISSS